MTTQDELILTYAQHHINSFAPGITMQRSRFLDEGMLEWFNNDKVKPKTTAKAEIPHLSVPPVQQCKYSFLGSLIVSFFPGRETNKRTNETNIWTLGRAIKSQYPNLFKPVESMKFIPKAQHKSYHTMPFSASRNRASALRLPPPPAQSTPDSSRVMSRLMSAARNLQPVLGHRKCIKIR